MAIVSAPVVPPTNRAVLLGSVGSACRAGPTGGGCGWSVAPAAAAATPAGVTAPALPDTCSPVVLRAGGGGPQLGGRDGPMLKCNRLCPGTPELQGFTGPLAVTPPGDPKAGRF